MRFEDIENIPCFVISLRNSTRKESSLQVLRDLGFKNVSTYEVSPLEEDNVEEYMESTGVDVKKFKNRAEMSCAKSHLEILKNFLQTDEEHIAIFEDDIVPHSKFHEHFSKLGELSLDKSDILYLGGWVWNYRFGNLNLWEVDDILEFQGQEYFMDQVNVYETHAYIASRKFAKAVLEYYSAKCDMDSMSIDNFYVWMNDTRKIKTTILAFSPTDSENRDRMSIRCRNNIGLLTQESHRSDIQSNNLIYSSFKDNNDGFIEVFDESDYSISYSYVGLDKTVSKNIKFPKTGVVTNLNARLDDSGLIITEDNKLLDDVSWFGDRYNRDMKQFKSLSSKRKELLKKNTFSLGGKCLNSYPIWSGVNYYHYLIDFIGRLEILNKSGLKLDYDWYYFPVPNFRLVDYVLEKLNIDKNRILQLSDDKLYQFDQIDTVLPNCDGRIVRPTSMNYIRNFFNVSVVENPTKKLYIKRKEKNRNISNDLELENLLLEFGFEFIDPSECEDVIDLFKNAKIVLGIHGAGLSNIVFSNRNTKVIELVPENRQYFYFCSMCRGLGMEYFPILSHYVSPNTYHVDVCILRTLLKGLDGN